MDFKCLPKLVRLVCLFLIVLLVSCSQPQEKPPVVVVESPIKKDVKVYGHYVGRLKAKKEVQIRARVDGFLTEICFKEGKMIKAGEVLFVIDSSEYVAEVNKNKAQVEQAKAAVAKAERDIIRLRPLYDQSAASQIDLDNAASALEKENANKQMKIAELQSSQIRLDFTKIVSPIDGYVGERRAEVGSLVGGSGVSLLTTIYQTDTVWVYFSMTALDYLRSKKRNVDLTGADSTAGEFDSEVYITRADRTEYPLKGRVDYANPQVDSKTGTFTLRAAIPNPDHEILPGQFTRVKVLLKVVENALLIPKKAITIEKGGAHIFVLRADKTVEKRMIEASDEVDNYVLVTRGVALGDKVIVEGKHKLQTGLLVQPTTTTDSIWINKPQNN